MIKAVEEYAALIAVAGDRRSAWTDRTRAADLLIAWHDRQAKQWERGPERAARIERGIAERLVRPEPI